MSINDFIRDDIRRLGFPQVRPSTGLQDRQAADRILAQKGTGLPANADTVTPALTSRDMRKEVITVYSHLVITEDGAFEMPLGWPANGAYPAGTPVPNPLPDSLTNVGGTLALDINVQYYQQRRVHLAVYVSGKWYPEQRDASGNLKEARFESDRLAEDDFYVPLALPFSSSEYYQGLDKYTASWVPKLQMKHIDGSGNAAPLVPTRVQELLAAGVTVDET